MTEEIEWLPSLVLFQDSQGDWNVYVEVLYQHFMKDFVDSKPYFEGRKVGLKRYPLDQGKESTFWHMISEGKSEEERLPDLRRCERIRWPRPVIEHHRDDMIKVWKNRRRSETRICLWLESYDYLVVLADRNEYVLPWTAYLVEQPHRKRKLQREYEKYWRDPF